jgi:hypothetical protein
MQTVYEHKSMGMFIPALISSSSSSLLLVVVVVVVVVVVAAAAGSRGRDELITEQQTLST